MHKSGIHNQDAVIDAAQILRLGSVSSACAPKCNQLGIAAKLAPVNERLRSDTLADIYANVVSVRLYHEGARVMQKLVACTLQTCTNHLLFGRRRFDYAIVDCYRQMCWAAK